MDRKLHDYFTAGVRQVWYVDPATREVRVYNSVEDQLALNERRSLEGGELLPGLHPVQQIFAESGNDMSPGGGIG